VDVQGGSAPPVRYLRAITQYGVILCTEHRTAYTPQNILEHLRQAHSVKGTLKKVITEWLAQQHFARDVSNPRHYSAPIHGLELLSGWTCHIGECQEISQSRAFMLRHCRQEHGLNSQEKVKRASAISNVSIQKWLAKSKAYFIVNPSVSQDSLPLDHDSTTPQSTFASTHEDFESSQLSLQSFQDRFSQAQSEAKAKHQRVSEAQHTSELSPWQRLTKFHEHFVELEIATIPGAYEVPRQREDHPFLFDVSQSVRRVLQQAHGHISSLHHVAAKRLNTFQVGTLSQDPFDRLQESASLDYYITNFVKLLCYFCRVQYEDYFKKTMFQETPAQHDAYSALKIATDTLQDFHNQSSDDDHHQEEQIRLEQDIDDRTLALCIALVEHHTPQGGFDSAILSYCAATCRAGAQGGWLPEGRCEPQSIDLLLSTYRLGRCTLSGGARVI
jgi:hypothetical protein